MITLRRSAPRPRITCFSRSWVSGRANFTPASSIAMALASAGPIQMGRTRSPSCSWRMTTGVLVVRSRPRWATRTWMTFALRSPSPTMRDTSAAVEQQTAQYRIDDADGGDFGRGRDAADHGGADDERQRHRRQSDDKALGDNGQARLADMRQILAAIALPDHDAEH